MRQFVPRFSENKLSDVWVGSQNKKANFRWLQRYYTSLGGSHKCDGDVVTKLRWKRLSQPNVKISTVCERAVAVPHGRTSIVEFLVKKKNFEQVAECRVVFWLLKCISCSKRNRYLCRSAASQHLYSSTRVTRWVQRKMSVERITTWRETRLSKVKRGAGEKTVFAGLIQTWRCIIYSRNNCKI